MNENNTITALRGHLSKLPPERSAYDRLDDYWKAVADFIHPRLVPGDRLIAPPDLADCFPNDQFQCQWHSYWHKFSGIYQWVALEKGSLLEAEAKGLLAACLLLEPVFANEVFVLYAERNRFKALSTESTHYQAFLTSLENEVLPACFAEPKPGVQGAITIPESPASARPATSITMQVIADPSSRALVQTYSEDRCRFIAMPENRVLCTILGKYLTYVDALDRGISPHLIFRGYWEMWITTVVARYARPGDTAVDIGANVGYFTLLLADAVGEGGRVVSFEPNPRLNQMLSMSVGLNGFFGRVNLRNEAVSRSSGGKLTFAIPRNEPGGAGLASSEAEKKAYSGHFGADVDFIDVPLIALDDLNLQNVGVVKVDAEGGELDIWLGMQNTIRQNPRICILLEFDITRRDALKLYDMIAAEFPVRYVDYAGQIQPLSLEMVNARVIGTLWMLFLSKDQVA